MMAAAASLAWHWAKRSPTCLPTRLAWAKSEVLSRAIEGLLACTLVFGSVVFGFGYGSPPAPKSVPFHLC